MGYSSIEIAVDAKWKALSLAFESHPKRHSYDESDPGIDIDDLLERAAKIEKFLSL